MVNDIIFLILFEIVAHIAIMCVAILLTIFDEIKGVCKKWRNHALTMQNNGKQNGK